MFEEAEILALFKMGASPSLIRDFRRRQIEAQNESYAAMGSRPQAASRPPAETITESPYEANELAARTVAARQRAADRMRNVVSLWASVGLARRPVLRPNFLSPSATGETWNAAIHEAGHIVCAIALDCPVISANVGDGMGNCELENPTGIPEAAVACLQAGAVSETLFVAGRVGVPSPTDRQLMAETTRDPAILATGLAAAKQILTENASAVGRVAAKLVAAGQLSGVQLVAAAGAVKRFPEL